MSANGQKCRQFCLQRVQKSLFSPSLFFQVILFFIRINPLWIHLTIYGILGSEHLFRFDAIANEEQIFAFRSERAGGICPLKNFGIFCYLDLIEARNQIQPRIII